MTGATPEGGGCNCIRDTYAVNEEIVASWWSGCDFDEENAFPCTTTCDCDDRFGSGPGGVTYGDINTAEFPADNLGVIQNSTW